MQVSKCVILVLLNTGVARAASTYTVTELLGPPQSTHVTPQSISSNGVAGSSDIDGNSFSPLGLPAILSPAGGTLLSTPDGYVGSGTGISSDGTVAGEIRIPYLGDPVPVMWTNGQMTFLPTGDLPSGQTFGINNAAVIAGTIFNGTTVAYPVIWTAGQVQTLGGTGDALAINNHNQVLIGGEYEGQNGEWIWAAGARTPVPSINGVEVVGRAMNDAGDLAGEIFFPGADGTLSIITHNGVATTLPDIPGDSGAAGFSINNHDQIVGSGYSLQPPTALLWEDGAVYNLNDLIPGGSGWVLSQAASINDDGVIVGNGYLNGLPAAFLLTPTIPSAPEPATLATLALAALCLIRRRP